METQLYKPHECAQVHLEAVKSRKKHGQVI